MYRFGITKCNVSIVFIHMEPKGRCNNYEAERILLVKVFKRAFSRQRLI